MDIGAAMKSPCYKCENRRPATKTTPDCHGQCNPYKDYQKWCAGRRVESHAKAEAHQVHQDSFRFKDGKLRRKR